MMENNESFLGRLAQDIVRNHPDGLEGICIVLPGRRAGLFLRKELAKHLRSAVEAPEFIPVNQFFEAISGDKISDRTSLIFELYLCWTSLRKENTEPFENFLSWGETALADFNEVDNYNIDASQFFRNLNEIREIEEWSLNAEELSPEQKAYIAFWRDLGELYFEFRKTLSEKNMSYAGMLKRNTIEQLPSTDIPWKKIYIAGLNALSITEQKLFFSLEKSGKAELYWDADKFFMEDDSQEAGDFIRSYVGSNGFKGYADRFLSKTQDIQVFGTASQIAQVKALGEYLGTLSDKADLNTAIVLADESLLIPLLHAIPEYTSGINVTLGYPLKWSPLSGLMDAVLNLQLRGARNNRGSNRFYFKDILAVINHPYIVRLLSDKKDNPTAKIASIMRKGKHVFPNFNNLENLDAQVNIGPLRFLFEQKNSVNELIDLMDELIRTLNTNALKQDLSLENEYLFRYAKLLERIRSYFDDYPFASEPSVLLKLLRQLVGGESIPFYGEPLQGLQVMGMLETRALDFERVIIVGANENFLPKPKYDPSFIPFDLKLAFGLPTYKQRDAIYAYYFYRLLSGAKEVVIYYNAEPGDFGQGEQSRFIPQLDHHLKKVKAPFKVKDQLVKNPISRQSSLSLKIRKSDLILQRIDQLLEHGFSPTAISTLTRCPLDFYFKYVAQIREVESVEEELEASTFGSAIHDSLEELYSSYKTQVLRKEHILAMKGKANEVLDKAFTTNYSMEELKYGSNHIGYEMAGAYLHRFLDYELWALKELETQGQHLSIVSLEKSYSAELDLRPYGFDKTIRLKGKADRVDRIGSTMRIIDYKTGKVEQKDLKFKDGAELTNSNSKSKALQLMVYSYMVNQSEGQALENLESGIISLRSISSGFMNLQSVSSGPGPSITEESIEQFKQGLADLLIELYDQNIPFEHRVTSKYCDFCS